MNKLVLTCWLIFIFSTCVYAQVEDFCNTDFTKADSIAELYPNHSLKNLKSLADKLTKPLSTEEEKFRSLYKWVCNNIAYDYALYVKHQQKKQKLKNRKQLETWNKTFSSVVFRNLLNKHKTVCAGYAYLLKELSFHAGLCCEIISGYGRTSVANVRGSGDANHAWNAVKLNNKWYLCDATWSAGAYDTRWSKYVREWDASYFLTDPSLFVRNHYPLDSTWMLLPKKPTLKEFLNGPLVYKSAFTYKINQLLPGTLDITTAKGKPVSFKFTRNSSVSIEQAELYIRGLKNAYSVYPKLYQDGTGLYCMDQTFAAKGTYVVHILLNRNYAFTYTIKVR